MALTGKLFDALALGRLAGAVVEAFGASGRAEFLRLCDAVDPSTSAGVFQDQPFATLAEAALDFLNQNGQVPKLLPALLEARPANAALRAAVGSLDQAALAAVSDARFAVEQTIAAHLSGAEAKALRDSLSQSDDLLVAINAYKAMHDALHMLQPLLPLIRQFATSASLWPQLRLHLSIFGLQLQAIDAATEKLRKCNRSGGLHWRKDIQEELDELGSALDRSDSAAVFDSASLLAGAVSQGLNDVDRQMLDVAEEAARPLQTSLGILGAINEPLSATKFRALAASYIEFASQMSAQLKEAIIEHNGWQVLDSQFQELQRVVIETQNLSVNVDSLWRIVARKLEELCGGPPPHSWAESLAERLDRLRSDLNPPITPPLADSARDGISDLIAQGRRRFMELDRNLLKWLEESVERRPELSTLLKGGE